MLQQEKLIVQKTYKNSWVVVTYLKLSLPNIKLYLPRGIDYKSLGLVNTVGLGISPSIVKSAAANLGVPNASSSPE